MSTYIQSAYDDGYKDGKKSMQATLEEVMDLIEGYVDVVDGDYGQPAPNKAMRAVQRIKESLGQSGY